MLKWVLIVLVALFLLVALVAVIGALLPKGHVASVRARYKKPPPGVWQAITEVERFAEWRPDVKKVEVLPPTGDGHAVYREIGRHGPLTLEVVASEKERRYVTRTADEKLPFGGTWTWEIEATPDGSAVRITEDGEIYNPLFRFLARFVFGYTGTMETYLRDLGKKFGEDVTPEAVAG